jgi:hypothetical protein
MAGFVSDDKTIQKGQWTVLDGSGVVHILSDLTINKSILQFNYAIFRVDTKLTIGDKVTLKYRDIQDMFIGYVIACRKIDSGGGNASSTYEVEIEEVAGETKYKYISHSNKDAVYIMNKNNARTVGQILTTILANSGWSNGMTGTAFNDAATVPETGAYLPAMGFSACSVDRALRRVIVDLMGYGIWYDETQGAKVVRFGEYNTDRKTNYPLPSDIRQVSTSKNYNIDRIMVFNDDKTLKSVQGTGNRSLAYRYSGCQSQAELDAMARKIWNDRKNISDRWEVDFPFNNELNSQPFIVHEGDILDIHSDQEGMPQKPSVDGIPAGYGVKDVKITFEKVTVGLGAANTTIFDIMAERLSVIDGDVVNNNYKEYDTGWIPAVAGASHEGQPNDYGVPVSRAFNIGGDTFYGELTATVTLAPAGFDGGSKITQYCFAQPDDGGQAASIDLTAGASYEYYIQFQSTEQYQDGSYVPVLPTSIQDGWVAIQYVFAAGGASTAIAEWQCEWGDVEFNSPATNVLVQNIKSTMTHHYAIPQMDSFLTPDENGYYPLLRFLITNSGSGLLKLRDIIITGQLNYLYDPAVSGIPEGDVPDTILLKLDALMPNQLHCTTYLLGTSYYMVAEPGISYDLAEIFPINTLTPGAHTFTVVTNEDVSIDITGQYLLFDEDVHVVKDGET